MDPRIARSRTAIRAAALDELGESGYGGFSIEAVAARAGVGRSTVYRHWDGKLALIADALDTLNVQPGPEIAGSPRERVEQILLHLVDVLGGSPFSACVPALIHAADHDPTVRAFHHAYNARRRKGLTDAIAAGVASGDFPAGIDVEAAGLAMAGAMFYRRLMTPEPPDPPLVTALIETVLGCEVR
jgi:TetR/AcrR family transcriptional regulator, regulator of autoinduction and epiphytic fitness